MNVGELRKELAEWPDTVAVVAYFGPDEGWQEITQVDCDSGAWMLKHEPCKGLYVELK